MNGLLIFLILIYLISLQLQDRDALPERFWLETRRALMQNDYLLRTAQPQGPLEQELQAVLRTLLKSGWERMPALDLLALHAQRYQQLGQKIAQIRWSYLSHLAFVTLLPLILRLFLQGDWLLGRDDAVEFGLALLLLILACHFLQRFWPRHGFCEPETSRDFAKVLLGAAVQPPLWAAELQQLRQECLLLGEDPAPRRESFLKSWFDQETLRVEKRIKTLEEALGPLELLASVVFGLLLSCTPLLSYFSEILH